MARRKLSSIEDYIRALRNGYGKEELESYRPWIGVRDVPSSGRSSVTPGITVKREHETLSDIETSMLYHADFSKSVTDIREQFPLFPLDAVQALAESVGIKYPCVPRTKTPAVLTTDFLLTIGGSNEPTYLAIAVKPSSELRKLRVLEKLEIERLWWESLNVKWKLVTEKSFSEIVTENLVWISSSLRGEQFVSSAFDFTGSSKILRKAITNRIYTIESLLDLCSVQLNVDAETAIVIIKYFLWNQWLLIDLETPIEESGLINIKGWNTTASDILEKPCDISA